MHSFDTPQTEEVIVNFDVYHPELIKEKDKERVSLTSATEEEYVFLFALMKRFKINHEFSKNKQFILDIEDYKRLRSACSKKIEPSVLITDKLKKVVEYVNKEFLSHPYKARDIFWPSEDNKMWLQGREIPRPNHGLAHSLRVAANIPLIIDFFRKHIHPEYTDLIQKFTPEKIELLQIVALFSVVGRKDETGFHTKKPGASDRYLSYRQSSADEFEKYVRANNIITDEAEIQYYKEVVLKMGDPKYDEPDAIILNLAHGLDLFRCYTSREMASTPFSFAQYCAGNFEKDLIDLQQFSITSIRATGDRLISSINDEGKIISAQKPYAMKTFAKANTNPEFTADTLNKLSNPIQQQVWRQEYEKATEGLTQGPRLKSDVTRDWDSLMKALLYDSNITCEYNSKGELIAHTSNYLFNITEMLKHAPDLEHIQFSDADLEEYQKFLHKKAKHKPSFKEMSNLIPDPKMYADRDKKNKFSHLHYGEKLAITLYTTEEMYKLINQFLRNQGKELDPHLSSKKLSLLVKEIILSAGVATQGLRKKPAGQQKDEEEQKIQLLTRVEDSKAMSQEIQKRKKAIKEDEERQAAVKAAEKNPSIDSSEKADTPKKTPLTQTAFTSASERVNFEWEEKKMDSKVETLQYENTLAVNIAELSHFVAEREALAPPFTQYQYLKFDENKKTFYNVPVRSLDHIDPFSYNDKLTYVVSSLISLQDSLSKKIANKEFEKKPLGLFQKKFKDFNEEMINICTPLISELNSILNQMNSNNAFDFQNSLMTLMEKIKHQINPNGTIEYQEKINRALNEMLTYINNILVFDQFFQKDLIKHAENAQHSLNDNEGIAQKIRIMNYVPAVMDYYKHFPISPLKDEFKAINLDDIKTIQIALLFISDPQTFKQYVKDNAILKEDATIEMYVKIMNEVTNPSSSPGLTPKELAIFNIMNLSYKLDLMRSLSPTEYQAAVKDSLGAYNHTPEQKNAAHRLFQLANDSLLASGEQLKTQFTQNELKEANIKRALSTYDSMNANPTRSMQVCFSITAKELSYASETTLGRKSILTK